MTPKDEKRFAALEARTIQLEAMHKEQASGGESVFRNGPFAPSYFIWEGRIASLSLEQFGFVELLWNAPGKAMNCQELAVAMYGSAVEDDRLRHYANKVNRKFEAPGVSIPLTISQCGNNWKLH